MRQYLHRWLLATGTVALVCVLAAARPPRVEPFSLVLVRTGNAWSATCESGCAWKTVRSERARILGTSVVIDSHGISGAFSARDTSLTFAFRVSADGSTGWKATGLRGTSWTALSFGCTGPVCRARITGAGVEQAR